MKKLSKKEMKETNGGSAGKSNPTNTLVEVDGKLYMNVKGHGSVFIGSAQNYTSSKLNQDVQNGNINVSQSLKTWANNNRGPIPTPGKYNPSSGHC